MDKLMRKYHELIEELLDLSRLLSEEELASDAVNSRKANLQARMYLVLLCSYLEGYAKEVGGYVIAALNNEVKNLGIPKSLALWALEGLDLQKKKQLQDSMREEFSLKNKRIKNRISDLVSANPARIETFWNILGAVVQEKYELDGGRRIDMTVLRRQIHQLVEIRNSIVHHGDTTSLISISDIEQYAKQVMLYLEVLNEALKKKYPSL